MIWLENPAFLLLYKSNIKIWRKLVKPFTSYCLDKVWISRNSRWSTVTPWTWEPIPSLLSLMSKQCLSLIKWVKSCRRHSLGKFWRLKIQAGWSDRKVNAQTFKVWRQLVKPIYRMTDVPQLIYRFPEGDNNQTTNLDILQQIPTYNLFYQYTICAL